VLFYGGATYGFAGLLREQVCKYMCPYARFQSAMFDKDTLVITYDEARGEPRGARGRADDFKGKGLGSCIDCGLCVQVCPTGIDIRKGLQYECIGCAACIDVCDSVMDKMQYPRGLVRYDTQNHMAAPTGRSAWHRVLRPRVLVYGSILALIVAAVATSLAMRLPFKVDVIRDRASLARLGPNGEIQNVYRLQLMNASERAQRFEFRVEGLPGLRLSDDASAAAPTGQMVEGSQARWVALGLELPVEQVALLKAGSHPVTVWIEARDALDGRSSGLAKEKTTFIVPR
jgi:cytochrome c oxidase accessory protein FixG